MLDVNNPREIKNLTGTEIEESGFSLYTANENSTSRVNKVTRQEEVIQGYRVPNTNANDGSKVKITDHYILSYARNDGFNVIDIKQGKSLATVPLYSGWWKFNDMTYLESIGKLLVVYREPIYTWPNANENDPGASAFTIDVKTGEIKPYLLTENRKQYLTLYKAAAAAAAYSYSPQGRCEARNNQYRSGSTLFENGKLYGIVVGYDCDEEAYVVAYREIYDAPSQIYMLRLTKKSFEDLNSLQSVGSTHRVCPLCNGHPVEFTTSTQSGWSDWEQKSLNIYVYTRKWETKTTTKRTTCTTCKGAALIKQ
jgi:hypothetical protein